MIYEKYNEYLGKFLFLTSIFVLIILLFNPLNNMIFTVDEYFTYGLLKFPVMQSISVTASDVHPPLYYLILKFFTKILSAFNLDMILVSKIVTIIPYLIILAVSGTKIKKEYGWLTAGLFTFSLYAMTEFIRVYCSIRMYSWAILFLVLSFIYLKEVITKSDLKSWGLFTLFTLLGAYTHYFCAISSICLYLILLSYFIIKKDSFKQEFKKWIISCIALAIGYAPWLFVLFKQLNKVHSNYWIPQIDLHYFIECLSFYSNTSPNIFLIALSIIFLVAIILISIFKVRNDDEIENKYVLMGLLVLISTLVLGIVISFLFKPILRVRYLLPAVGVFWFAVSVLMGKIENKKVFTIMLVVICLLGIFGIAESISGFQNDYQTAIQDHDFLNDLDNNNTTIICIGPGEVIQFGTYFNESHVYMFNMTSPYGVHKSVLKDLFDIKYTTNLNKTVSDNNESNIYVFMGDWNECELINGTESIHNFASNYVYKYN